MELTINLNDLCLMITADQRMIKYLLNVLKHAYNTSRGSPSEIF